MINTNTMSTSAKDNRIDLRISLEQKELLAQAATLKGLSLSAYLLLRSLEAAQTDIAETTRLILSDRDRDLFLHLMVDPPQPTSALLTAMAEFQATTIAASHS